MRQVLKPAPNASHLAPEAPSMRVTQIHRTACFTQWCKNVWQALTFIRLPSALWGLHAAASVAPAAAGVGTGIRPVPLLQCTPGWYQQLCSAGAGFFLACDSGQCSSWSMCRKIARSRAPAAAPLHICSTLRFAPNLYPRRRHRLCLRTRHRLYRRRHRRHSRPRHRRHSRPRHCRHSCRRRRPLPCWGSPCTGQRATARQDLLTNIQILPWWGQWTCVRQGVPPGACAMQRGSPSAAEGCPHRLQWPEPPQE
jgi:hypothetical protein